MWLCSFVVLEWKFVDCTYRIFSDGMLSEMGHLVIRMFGDWAV